VAKLIQRWLGLAWNVQQECTMAWTAQDGLKGGSFSGNAIGHFVIRKGLPPIMASARATPVTLEDIQAMFAKPLYHDGLPMG
jgi:hypothetical protein